VQRIVYEAAYSQVSVWTAWKRENCLNLSGMEHRPFTWYFTAEYTTRKDIFDIFTCTWCEGVFVGYTRDESIVSLYELDNRGMHGAIPGRGKGTFCSLKWPDWLQSPPTSCSIGMVASS
jgi:hypothetical protein